VRVVGGVGKILVDWLAVGLVDAGQDGVQDVDPRLVSSWRWGIGDRCRNLRWDSSNTQSRVKGCLLLLKFLEILYSLSNSQVYSHHLGQGRASVRGRGAVRRDVLVGGERGEKARVQVRLGSGAWHGYRAVASISSCRGLTGHQEHLLQGGTSCFTGVLSAPQGTGHRQRGLYGEGDAPVSSGRGQVRVGEASGHTTTTGRNCAGGRWHTGEREDTGTPWNSFIELARRGSVSQQGLQVSLGFGGAIGLRLCVLRIGDIGAILVSRRIHVDVELRR